VKLSLFVEVTIPRPWTDTSERDAFSDVLDQIELADKLGFHSVWITEHHFMEEYCHASAPEILLAALARSTTDIRLGHGIAQMPPGINHPARVAERVATLDLISNGRVEFGTGESSSVAELDGFRIDPGRKRAMWAEGVKVATRCMAETPFTGFAGEYVDMPSRNVVPKPLQKPHPPVWVACTRPETIQMAAENGIGALSFITKGGPDEARQRVREYYETFASSAAPIGLAPNANVLYTGGNLMCAETGDEALDRLGDLGGFFGWAVGYYYVNGVHHPGRDVLWEQYESDRAAKAADRIAAAPKPAGRSDWAAIGQSFDSRRSPSRGVGTVESIGSWIQEYEATGVDELLLQLPPVRHEFIMESLEQVGRRILPALRERDEAFAAAKAARMAPVYDQAMARRVDDAPPLDPEYAFGGVPASWESGRFASEIAESSLGLAPGSWKRATS
jgi:alkanesulfonate monooxygenase SsuD/methylene tetrahydromethanopterin reductase-like flavin-dependent oxidoreductase (luciferase family)